MFRPRLALSAALLVLLSACATTDEATASADATTAADARTAATDTAASSSTDTTTTNSTVGGCNADAARGVVGQIASTEVIDQARLAAGAETARTLKPGQAVTMEFNGNRLNLDVDAGNAVTNVRCG